MWCIGNVVLSSLCGCMDCFLKCIAERSKVQSAVRTVTATCDICLQCLFCSVSSKAIALKVSSRKV